MANSVRIKVADPEDAESMMQFLRVLNRESDTVIVDPNLAKLTVRQERQQIKLINYTLDNVVMIAMLKKRCIGIVTVRRRAHSSGELGVAVAKQFRHRGLGRILVQEAIQWLRSFSNLHILWLTVEVKNQDALRLYRDCGFKIISKKEVQDTRHKMVPVIKMAIS